MSDPVQARNADDDMLDWLDSTGKQPGELAAPGAFHNFGDGLGTSAMGGLARLARSTAIFAPAALEAVGTGLTPEGKDAYYKNVVGTTERWVDNWTPDAANVGTAGRVVNGLVQGLTPLVAGPVGLIGTAGVDSGVEALKSGATVNQAVGLTAVNAAAMAVGYKLPPAFGTTLAQRVASGAGGNLAIDVASRKAGQAIAGDNKQLSAQYDNTSESAGVAALLGAAFGLHAHVADGSVPREAAPTEQAAVLTANNADHFTRQTMPGEPLNGAAAVASQQNVESALRSLVNGEPVDVPHKDLGGMFNVRPDIRAQATGDAYGHMLVALESGGVADAKAPTSSATGLHQFTSSTWLRTVRSSSPKWAAGLTDAEILAQRTNPERSSQMEGVLRAENAAALTNAGQDATDPFNLYAAHHFGASKGVAFAKAGGDVRMDALLTEGQLTANPYLRNMTKAEVMANWSNRARRSGVDVPEQIAADVAREPLLPPEFQSRYTALDLRQEIGWSQKGGEMVRDAVDPAILNPAEAAGMVDAMPKGEVIGRTRWTGWPSPDGEESVFWKNRPDKGLSEKAANVAMDKFERGDALKPIERRFIDHAEATAKDYGEAMHFLEETHRGYSESQRLDGLAALRDQHDVHVLEADHAEAVGVYELAHRAADRGIEPFDIARSSNESEPAYAGRLWGLIQEADRANPRATPETRGSGNQGREGGPQRIPVADQTGSGRPEPATLEGNRGGDSGQAKPAAQGSGQQVARDTDYQVEAAASIAADTPDMPITLEDGTATTAGEAYARADAEIVQAEADAKGFAALAACAMRYQ
jgi:hypothetical protein